MKALAWLTSMFLAGCVIGEMTLRYEAGRPIGWNLWLALAIFTVVGMLSSNWETTRKGRN